MIIRTIGDPSRTTSGEPLLARAHLLAQREQQVDPRAVQVGGGPLDPHAVHEGLHERDVGDDDGAPLGGDAAGEAGADGERTPCSTSSSIPFAARACSAPSSYSRSRIAAVSVWRIS